jgi:hypothetical protein
MHPGLKLQRIRNIVRNVFVRLSGAEQMQVEETFLIRDGFYVGHRFDFDGLQAIWFIEEHELKVYDRAGQLVDALELAEPDESREVA